MFKIIHQDDGNEIYAVDGDTLAEGALNGLAQAGWSLVDDRPINIRLGVPRSIDVYDLEALFALEPWLQEVFTTMGDYPWSFGDTELTVVTLQQFMDAIKDYVDFVEEDYKEEYDTWEVVVNKVCPDTSAILINLER
jgi:hypothetical protein